MAPPAVRETLNEGRDKNIKHTDGEINVSIEIKCYYYRPKKWRMTPLKRPLGQICIFSKSILRLPNLNTPRPRY
jgi:hypothetical protein